MLALFLIFTTIAVCAVVMFAVILVLWLITVSVINTAMETPFSDEKIEGANLS